jgi:hypothetical protein
MGRNSVLIRVMLLAVLFMAPATAVHSTVPDPLRMVKLGGSPGAPATLEHVRFSLSLGFNALWVYGHQAGVWTHEAAPQGVRLHDDFLKLARWCTERDVRIFVSISPVSASRGKFLFHDRRGEKRIRKFIKALRRKAGVHDFVLSFDDMPLKNVDLNDFLRYGRSTAPAHLDLSTRVVREIRKGESFWLTAAAYCDAHLGDGTGPYSSAFLAGLPDLPKSIGMVWTGPEVISASITAEDLRNSRKRLGGRKFLLYDNYPVNDDGRRLSLGLILGPLRNRGPRIGEEIVAYLACPMSQLGASRLPLRTVAAWLEDPAGYEPDPVYEQAMSATAGGNKAALKALKTQALEWGGWVGGRNYHHVENSNIYSAVSQLKHPAYVARWDYTRRRYPERIAALLSLADTVFRDDLIMAMERNLAVARVIPLVVEYEALKTGHRPDAQKTLETILNMRDGIQNRHVRAFLASFLEAAGIPDHLSPEK